MSTSTKRGAKPLTPATPVGPELDPAKLKERHQELQTMAAVDKTVLGWMQAAQQVGRMQAHAFHAAVSDRALLETYKNVRDSKCYVGMTYIDEHGKPEIFQDLETFCRVGLGKSYRRFQQLIENERLLGPELYEQAEALRLTQRDYNALKALPAADQEVIKQALADKADRETVIDKLVTLAERQAQEKTRQQEQLADNEQRISNQAKQLDTLNERLAKAQRQWKVATPDERTQLLRSDVEKEAHQISVHISSSVEAVASLHNRIAALLDHAQHQDEDHGVYLAGVIAEIERQLHWVRDKFGIPHLAAGDPAIEAQAMLFQPQK